MRALALQVQNTLNNIASLFGLVPNRVAGSTTIPNEVIYQLAARHHGLPNGEYLLRPGKCLKLSKIRNKCPPIVVYEETRDGNVNDIWLGHLRFTGFFSISSNKHVITEKIEEADQDESETIFLFPYERKDGEMITNLLVDNATLLSPLDIQSLAFCSASTGSSRLLRSIGKIVKKIIDSKINLSEFLLLDTLNCSSIVRFKMDCENDIFTAIGNLINKNVAEETVVECYRDSRLLDKIATLFSLRRTYNEVTPMQIKTFGDFVCDRLEFISPKIITNIVSAVGNSKCLDEFWMFMMAKRIQDTAQQYEPEDLATVIDTYATATLEDTGFYEAACENVKKKIDQFTPHQLAIVLSALAKVRIRDLELVQGTLEIIKHYLLEEYHSEIFGQSTKSLHKRDLSQDILVIAYTLVAASELDYRDDTLDLFWRILALRLKETVFDISGSTWLPFAIAAYPSPTSLRTFLPIWVNHVNTIIKRIKSKTFARTVQRRHALLLQCLKTGIVPKEFVMPSEIDTLNDICKSSHFGGIRQEECGTTFTPESSTFHLEVSACLRGLQVHHQRELQSIPFVLDIVIPQHTPIKQESAYTRAPVEDWQGYNLHHNRYSPNHRKHKRETYIYRPTD